jgi:hypothetical protein
MVYRVRKNAALLFYLRLYGILLKHFLMNETGYQETGYLMGGWLSLDLSRGAGAAYRCNSQARNLSLVARKTKLNRLL